MAQVSSIPKVINLNSEGVIFFMRHGQCKSNVEWPINNYTDEKDPLTELGISQAEGAGNFLKKRFPNIFWNIVTSNLLRAKETGKIVCSITNSNILHNDERINEFDSSNETIDNFQERLESFLKDAVKIKNNVNERLLIVAHGFVLEKLICHSLSVKINIIDKGDHGGQKGICTHANCGISAFYNNELLMWNYNPN